MRRAPRYRSWRARSGCLEAERHFEAVVPRSVPMVFHGHRLGFVYLGRGVLQEAGSMASLAAGIARDVAEIQHMQHQRSAPSHRPSAHFAAGHGEEDAGCAQGCTMC